MIDWMPWVISTAMWPVYYKISAISPVATGATLVTYGAVMAAIYLKG